MRVLKALFLTSPFPKLKISVPLHLLSHYRPPILIHRASETTTKTRFFICDEVLDNAGVDVDVDLYSNTMPPPSEMVNLLFPHIPPADLQKPVPFLSPLEYQSQFEDQPQPQSQEEIVAPAPKRVRFAESPPFEENLCQECQEEKSLCHTEPYPICAECVLPSPFGMQATARV